MKKEMKLKVVWEQESDPNAADRVLKAFEMLLAKAMLTKSVQKGVENYFDRDALKNDHGRCQKGNDQEYIHSPTQ